MNSTLVATPPTTILDPAEEVPISPEEYNNILSIQSSIFEMITLKSNAIDILNKLCQLSETLLDNSVASIMLVDNTTGLMSITSAPSIPQTGHDAIQNLKPGPGGGSCGNAIFSNKAQYVEDTKTDKRWCDFRQIAYDFNICSCWSCPVRDQYKKAIGSFALSSFEHRTPAPFHKKLLEVGAHLVAIVLKNEIMSNEILAYQNDLEHKVTQRTKELKNSLDNLKAMQHRLVENEKMALLGQLVAGVAHEINTPLGICITASSMLEEFITKLNNVKSRTEFSAAISQLTQAEKLMSSSLGRTVSLVNLFREVAVTQNIEEKQKIKLQSYTKDIVTSLHSQYCQYKLDFHIEDKQNISLNTYPNAYAEVLSKLLLNSLQHGLNEDKKHNIWIKFSTDNNQLIMQYGDDGTGVDDDCLAILFDPFYTSTRKNGSVGLGLHIAYNIVTQKLKGQIEAEKRPGGGLQFNISLPLHM